MAVATEWRRSLKPSVAIPSRLQLPPGPWATVLDGLCARFPAIERAVWIDRFARGRVLDAAGVALAHDAPYRVGAEIRYFREVPHEPAIPFEETVLHADAHLVVADKPHFLPVTPAGPYVRETLVARLIERLGNPDLAPLHRIDRDTAGLVLFSADPASRGAYQALFRERLIHKRYEAIAPALPGLDFPLIRATCLIPGDPFFRMQEGEGAPNSCASTSPHSARRSSMTRLIRASAKPRATTIPGRCSCLPRHSTSSIRSAVSREVFDPVARCDSHMNTCTECA